MLLIVAALHVTALSFIVGVAIYGLALLAPTPKPLRRLTPGAIALRLIWAMVGFGAAMSGVFIAEGISPARAVAAGAIAGIAFTIVMAVVFALGAAFIYRFRRPYWDFGKAWMESGLAQTSLGWGVTKYRRILNRSRVLRRMRSEWLREGYGHVTARQFIEERRSEIDSDLRS